jgi:hypothetical protein
MYKKSMNTIKSPLNKLGFLACALVLGTGLRVQAAANTVSLFASDPVALEGTSTGAFTLIRTGDTNDALTVTVAISGTASNGIDYSTISSNLVIPVGFYSLDVTVQPILDTARRGNKTVVLTLETNAAYAIERYPRAEVRIIDDVFDIPPPTISLTNPISGAVFTAPAKVTIDASLSDPNIPIKSISFFANDFLVGTVTNTPYSLVVSNLHAGNYGLFARAEDIYGVSAVSAVVNITVSDVPVVTLTSPDGTSASVGFIVALDATIGDPNESISSVSFYSGTKLLGTVTNAPFDFNWQTTTTGTYELHAVATDKNTHKQGTSNTVKFVVTPTVGGN